MDVAAITFFIIGLVLLFVGAEWLVRGASRLAAAVGISPLVIGLTVVAFGTGSPELAVSVQASLLGQPDITLGNIIGSNICNVLLVLGLSALLAPMSAAQRLVRLEVPLLIGVSVFLLLIALDKQISRLDGVLLFTGAVSYTVWSMYQSRKENLRAREGGGPASGNAPHTSPGQWGRQSLLIVAGLGCLVLGSRWLVDGAIAFARMLGVSDLIIGLTVIAVGTSVPEIATSVVAGLRGERDIAVGNVVGSNLFNILVVLGLTSIVAPQVRA